MAQISPRLGDVETNLAIYEERARAARGLGADLLVFPELSLTGYFLKDMVSTVALRLDSPEVKRLARAQPRDRSALRRRHVEETDDYRFYNSAVYFEDGAHRARAPQGLPADLRPVRRGPLLRARRPHPQLRFGASGAAPC